MSAMKLGLFIAIIRAFTSVAPMADSSPSRFAGFILPLHHSIRVLTLSLLVAATHGTASGQSPLGNALSFNGTNYATVANFGNIIPTNEITVEFWAYTPKFIGQSAFQLSPDSNGNRLNAHLNYGSSYADALTYWDFGNISTGGRVFAACPPNSISNWVHYALVASQGGNFMRIYTNGVLQISRSGMTPFVRGSYSLRIGGPDFAYSGSLDELRIWKTARSQALIQAAMNLPLVGNEPDLVVYYKFDNASGAVATNSATATGAAYDGILANSPVWIASTVPTFPGALTLPATRMSNTVATLNGTVNSGSSATTAWFEWGLFPFNNSNTTAPLAVGSGNSFVTVSNVLSGLTPGVIYHGRLVASNALGVARGRTVRFGSPAITLNSPAVLTNECHTAYVDPAVATDTPLAIAGGYNHSLALKSDGTVAAWGGNGFGQTNIPVGLSNVVAIAGGRYHSLALKSDGTVAAWGENGSGQTTIPVGLGNVVAIAGGDYHSLALKSDGTVAAWGYNAYGQTTIPVGLSNVVAIAGGFYHSLALKSDGTVAAWGDNLYGQTTIPVGLSNVVAIAGGFSHSLALKSDGTVAAWGDNGSGQTTIPVGLSNVVAIAGGDYHSLALKSDGKVAAWGENGFGQTTIPVGLSNVVAIAGGGDHSLALKSDGTVAAWGNNGFGQTTIPVGLNALKLITSGSANTNTPGNYLLSYSSSNSLGGVATATRTVVVRDTLPPVITLLGNNPVLITNVSNLPFVDPGAAVGFDLCMQAATPVLVSNSVNVNFPGTYAITYRSTDSSGNTASANRTVIVALPPAVPGDQNGDGIVSQSELDAVYGNYLPNSPWLFMTNMAGLGGTNVTFALANSALGAYTVEYSTNLTGWQPLGPATPRYLFTDTNAPAVPQRYYRLVYP